jgi:hypothetical protein
MYQLQSSALGFSLPSWLNPLPSLEAAVKGIAGAVISGTTVSVPTPLGTQVFNLGDPSQRAALEAFIKNLAKTKVNVSPVAPGSAPKPAGFADQIPGGWLTIAAVGLGLMFVMGQGRRKSARA